MKADLFVKQNDKSGAICSFIDLLRRLCEQGLLVSSTASDSSTSNNKLD